MEEPKNNYIIGSLLLLLGLLLLPSSVAAQLSGSNTGSGARLLGQVYVDRNQNGLKESDEAGVAGVPVTVYFDTGDATFDAAIDRRIGTDPTTISSTGGNFTVSDLAAGDYFVRVDAAKLPKGFTLTSDAVVGPLRVRSGQASVQFGIFSPTTPAEGGTILGFVVRDENSNQKRDRNEKGVEGVTATLYRDDGNGVFDAAFDQQQATTRSSSDGSFEFIVTQQGRYFVQIKARGLANTLLLSGTGVAGPVDLTSGAVVQQDLFVRTKPVEVVSQEKEQLKIGVGALSVDLNDGVVAAGSIRAIQRFAPWFSLGLGVAMALIFAMLRPERQVRTTYLRVRRLFDYLRKFTRRGTPIHGVIYNSLSGAPVALALVHLVEHSEERIVANAVSASDGSFVFHCSIDARTQYSMTAHVDDYIFPSQLVSLLHDAGSHEGGWQQQDRRHGFLLPVDPVPLGEKAFRNWVWREKLGRDVMIVLVGLSFLAMVLAFGLSTYGLFFLGVVLFTMVRINALQPLPIWGRVLRRSGKKPQRHAVVSLYDQVFGRVVARTTTDRKGRYGFVAAPGLYYVRVADVALGPVQQGYYNGTSVRVGAQGLTGQIDILV